MYVRRNDWLPLLKETWTQFQGHKAQWLAAAISYFTMFAIAPLIIVIVEIAGLFLGHHRAALDDVIGYLQHTAGKSAAAGVRAMVDASFSQHRAGLIAQMQMLRRKGKEAAQLLYVAQIKGAEVERNKEHLVRIDDN